MIEKMYQESAKVLWNKKVGPDYFKIGLACQEHYANAKPGQFIMLRVGDRLFPLLRRPFSIHRLIVNADQVQGIELLYKVVGEGTKLLSSCRPDDMLDILGPLGKGFFISEKYHRIYIVAGGIGVVSGAGVETECVGEGELTWVGCEVGVGDGGTVRGAWGCSSGFKSIPWASKVMAMTVGICSVG